MYNATIMCVHAYAYVRERACVRACACVTIVVHTDMYAVAGILRNMQVFNCLLRILKYRLHVHVQCNYTVRVRVHVRARACVRVRKCASVGTCAMQL